jgi:hypothetical protein
MRTSEILFLCALLLTASHVSAAQCSVEQPALATVKGKKGASVKGPFSITELERTHKVKIRESGEWLPFGYANAQWLEFKATVMPGDRIYSYSFRENRFYSDGHILVRKGCIIRHLLGSIS